MVREAFDVEARGVYVVRVRDGFLQTDQRYVMRGSDASSELRGHMDALRKTFDDETLRVQVLHPQISDVHSFLGGLLSSGDAVGRRQEELPGDDGGSADVALQQEEPRQPRPVG